jgi:hypothetical protein
MVRPQAGDADWMPRKPPKLHISPKRNWRGRTRDGFYLIDSRAETVREGYGNRKELLYGAIYRGTTTTRADRSRQQQLTTAYETQGISKGTLIGQKYLSRGLYAGTHPPCLARHSAEPHHCRQSSELQLKQLPLQTSELSSESDTKLHKLNSLPYQSHINSQWLLSRSVILCPRASSSSTYLSICPSQSIQVLSSSSYALQLQTTDLPRAPY